MHYLPLILALTGFGLFLTGALSLLLTRRPNELNVAATYVGMGMLFAGRLAQLVTRFVSDVRGHPAPARRSPPTKTVSPGLAWGVLGVMLLIGLIAVCWVYCF